MQHGPVFLNTATFIYSYLACSFKLLGFPTYAGWFLSLILVQFSIVKSNNDIYEEVSKNNERFLNLQKPVRTLTRMGLKVVRLQHR